MKANRRRFCLWRLVSWATCGEHLAITQRIKNTRCELVVMCCRCSERAMPVKRKSIQAVRSVCEVRRSKRALDVLSKSKAPQVAGDRSSLITCGTTWRCAPYDAWIQLSVIPRLAR
ncbi:hypothetical protein BDN67DRAFT_962270 [Paxillus ammoniavirescens]|nr:hypothetical protein BDN67DRAFT_962270 [Paxillus ammoniavirescens]